jgi:hypothetical protein
LFKLTRAIFSPWQVSQKRLVGIRRSSTLGGEEEESALLEPSVRWSMGDVIRQLAEIIIATGHPANHRGDYLL